MQTQTKSQKRQVNYSQTNLKYINQINVKEYYDVRFGGKVSIKSNSSFSIHTCTEIVSLDVELKTISGGAFHDCHL